MAFVAQRQNLLDGDLSGVLAQLLDIGESSVDLLLSAMRFRHDPRDRPAMPRDDDRLPPFDIVKQPGKVGFGFGRLNFARHGAFQLVESTGRYSIDRPQMSIRSLRPRSPRSCAVDDAGNDAATLSRGAGAYR